MDDLRFGADAGRGRVAVDDDAAAAVGAAGGAAAGFATGFATGFAAAAAPPPLALRSLSASVPPRLSGGTCLAMPRLTAADEAMPWISPSRDNMYEYDVGVAQ